MTRKQFFLPYLYLPFGEGEAAADDTLQIIRKVVDGKEEFYTPEGKRLFTQDHMNAEIGNVRTTTRSAAEKEKSTLIEELKAVRQQATDRGQNVEELSARITELEEASMTIEERSASEIKRYEQELAGARQLQEHAHNMFAEERINNEIMAACTTHKAVSSKQIAALLRNNTELKPIKDSKGEKITGYEAFVNFQDVDDDGKSVMKKLPIAGAVARMRELKTEYGNLFKSETEGGTGASTLFGDSPATQSSQAPDFSKEVSMKDYSKWAEANLDTPAGG